MNKNGNPGTSSIEESRSRFFLKELDWIFIALLWIAALILGYSGFSEYFSQLETPVSQLDLIYLTAQLVTLESGGITSPLPLKLEIARFALPILVAFTAIKTLALVFMEQAQQIRMFFIRDHVVICGLNRQALLMAEGFLNRSERVIVVNGNEANPLLEQARSMSIFLVQGDPNRRIHLERAALKRARLLVCVLEDDRLNAEIAVHAQRLAKEKRRQVLPCFIHIVEPQLWDILQNKALGSMEFDHLRLELFNVFDRGAKTLLQETLALDPLLEWNHSCLLVVGMGNLGKNLIVHAARAAFQTSNSEGENLRILVLDRNAIEKCAALQIRFPQLSTSCDLIPVDINFHSSEFAQGAFLFDRNSELAVDVGYLCLEDESLNLSIFLTLIRNMKTTAIPLFVRSRQTDGLSGFLPVNTESENTFGNLHIFPLLERTSTPDILSEGNREVLAISLHNEYIQPQRRAGADPSMPALQPWSTLSERFKEANRKQVDRMQSHLTSIACTITPDPEWGVHVYQFSEEEIEQIACLEHRGWCEDLHREGWKYAPVLKDPEQKLHPALVPWEELSESDREKNRIPVRQLPELLAGLGFRIIPVDRV